MKRTTGRDCPGDDPAFKVLAGREKRHNHTRMTGLRSGLRGRTIGVGLCRADRKAVSLDRPEVSRDVNDARHGNGNHAGDPDQGPEVTQPCAEVMEHVVEHAALEAITDFPSMT